MAGRTTLIMYVLNPVSNHAMSMLKLPLGLIAKLNRYKRNFLLGRDKDKRKMHNLSWPKVCRPLDYGGLGVRDLNLKI